MGNINKRKIKKFRHMSKFQQKIKVAERPKSTFDKSHEKKLTCNMGELVPILLEEVMPGDHFKVNNEVLGRLAPLATPMMHRVDMFIHYFFVPTRLLWEDYEDFFTGGLDGTEVPLMPFVAASNANKAYLVKGSLWDYFGLPLSDGVTTISNPIYPTALPFRAYLKIYNDWYRDPNLTAEIDINVTSGEDTDVANLFQLRTRAWEKDYFTSALPWTQRGDDVSLPIDPQTAFSYKTSSGSTIIANGIGNAANATGFTTDANGKLIPTGGLAGGNVSYVDNISAITTTVDAVTIPEFRAAVALQAYLERNAVAGPRYIEQMLVNYGHKVPDYRARRAEYLGGSKNAIQVSEVLQTSESNTTPQGNLSGHGITAGLDEGFSETFDEHGYIIGILSVMPKTSYMQGVEKLWMRSERTHFAIPDFAHIGEQEIFDYELYHDFTATGGSSSGVFGYTERYAEYKYSQNKVCGEFRDDYKNWTLVREFSSAPSLNENFVECQNDAALHRVFADTDPSTDKIFVQMYFDIEAKRPLPYFSTPRLMG